MKTTLENLVIAADNFFRGSVASGDAVREALAILVASGHIRQLLEKQIEEFVKQPAHELPTVDSSRMVLHLGDTFSVMLSLPSKPGAHLYSQPFRGFVAPISGAGIDLDRYTVPPGWSAEVYSADTAISPGETELIKVGSVAFFDGSREVVEARCKSQDTVCLKVFEYPRSALEWAFSRATYEPIGVISSDPVASRRQYIVKTLGEIGDPSSTDALQTMLNDPAHFVRWAAVQAIANCNEDAAIAGLKQLSSDLHRHLRAAARRALAVN